MIRKITSCLLCLGLVTGSCPARLSMAAAQGLVSLPAAGALIMPSEEFAPALIKGIRIDPVNPFHLDFIVDAGQSGLTGQALKDEGARLIRYFLAALTTPSDELWVNLSPYEGGRIIPDRLAGTELGCDLLAQDYLLKQLTASLVYPEQELGADFWQRVYAAARARYGQTDVPVETFNKVWVVPQTALVYEHGDVAVIAESHLRVMMEEDYLARAALGSAGAPTPADPDQETARPATEDPQAESLRALILPAIEREVNAGRHFATLRQIYHSMILAVWYKRNLREGVLGRAYADQGKVRGVDVADPAERDRIYQRYLAAFEQGVYNYIKEDLDPETGGVVPRRYFSGGIQGRATEQALEGREVTADIQAQALRPGPDTPLYTLTTGLAVRGGRVLPPLAAVAAIRQMITEKIARLSGQQDVDILVVLDGPQSGVGKSTFARVMAEHFAVDGFLVEEGVTGERRFGERGRIVVRESKAVLTQDPEFYNTRRQYEAERGGADSLWIYLASAAEMDAIHAGELSAVDRTDLVIDYSQRPALDQIIAAWQAPAGASSPVHGGSGLQDDRSLEQRLAAFGIDVAFANKTIWSQGSGRIDIVKLPDQAPWVMDEIRPVNDNAYIATSLADMPEVTLVPRRDDMLLLSNRGTNSQGIFLGIIKRDHGEQHPAAIKIFRPNIQEAYLRELIAAQIYGNHLGILPEFYGVLRDDQGKVFGYAMSLAVLIDSLQSPYGHLKDAPDYAVMQERAEAVGVSPLINVELTRKRQVVGVDAGAFGGWDFSRYLAKIGGDGRYRETPSSPAEEGDVDLPPPVLASGAGLDAAGVADNYFSSLAVDPGLLAAAEAIRPTLQAWAQARRAQGAPPLSAWDIGHFLLNDTGALALMSSRKIEAYYLFDLLSYAAIPLAEDTGWIITAARREFDRVMAAQDDRQRDEIIAQIRELILNRKTIVVGLVVLKWLGNTAQLAGPPFQDRREAARAFLARLMDQLFTEYRGQEMLDDYADLVLRRIRQGQAELGVMPEQILVVPVLTSGTEIGEYVARRLRPLGVRVKPLLFTTAMVNEFGRVTDETGAFSKDAPFSEPGRALATRYLRQEGIIDEGVRKVLFLDTGATGSFGMLLDSVLAPQGISSDLLLMSHTGYEQIGLDARWGYGLNEEPAWQAAAEDVFFVQIMFDNGLDHDREVPFYRVETAGDGTMGMIQTTTRRPWLANQLRARMGLDPVDSVEMGRVETARESGPDTTEGILESGLQSPPGPGASSPVLAAIEEVLVEKIVPLTQMIPGQDYTGVVPVRRSGVVQAILGPGRRRITGTTDDFLRRRGAADIEASGLASGCGDYGVVFYEAMRARGYRVNYVDAVQISPLGFLGQRAGHVVVEVYDEPADRWILVDPQEQTIIAADWDVDRRFFFQRIDGELVQPMFWIGFRGPLARYQELVYDAASLKALYAKIYATVDREVVAEGLPRIDMVPDPALADDAALQDWIARWQDQQELVLDRLRRDFGVVPRRGVRLMVSWDPEGAPRRVQLRGQSLSLGRETPVSEGIYLLVSDLLPRTAVAETVLGNSASPDVMEQADRSSPVDDQRDTVGGIDLNEALLDLRTQGLGADFVIPYDPQAMDTILIDGLSPVILQMAPTNLPVLLGTAPSPD